VKNVVYAFCAEVAERPIKNMWSAVELGIWGMSNRGRQTLIFTTFAKFCTTTTINMPRLYSGGRHDGANVSQSCASTFCPSTMTLAMTSSHI